MSWKALFLMCVMFTITLPLQLMAEPYYVHSEQMPLNVRSGPGTENAIVARLSHGTQVSLLERWGVWARISTPQGEAAGWVLQRYLALDPPASAVPQADMSVEEEQRRFTRLQRKGIITIQRSGNTGVLRLTIQLLIWRHLTPQEQQNFLQRAQRLFGGKAVDIHDHHTRELLARLTATGTFESAAISENPAPFPMPPGDSAMPPVTPPSPRAP